MDPKIKREKRIRRHKRVRAKIFGTAKRPRLSVYKSLRHIWVQLIDDTKGHTLASASTKEIEESKKMTKTEKAFKVGELIAQKAKKLKIKTAVFDRGGFKYTGRIKAVADGARKQGLKI